MRPFIWILSFILVSGLVFGITLKNEAPNKDKLLIRNHFIRFGSWPLMIQKK